MGSLYAWAYMPPHTDMGSRAKQVQPYGRMGPLQAPRHARVPSAHAHTAAQCTHSSPVHIARRVIAGRGMPKNHCRQSHAQDTPRH